ncbi:hypothetical protein GQ600_16763 [Phytophthora cactorum]|nr:hypothetical protein GQ600_16763 [Phytophthora cactorum]
MAHTNSKEERQKLLKAAAITCTTWMTARVNGRTLSIDDMADVRTNEDGSQLQRQRLCFPRLSKISKSVIKTDDSSPGCENARVEWGKKMLNRHSLHCSNVLFEISIEMGCPRVGTFDNNGATSGSPLTRSAALVPSTGLCLRRLNDDSTAHGEVVGWWTQNERLRPFCVICWTKQLRMKTRNWRLLSSRS